MNKKFNIIIIVIILILAIAATSVSLFLSNKSLKDETPEEEIVETEISTEDVITPGLPIETEDITVTSLAMFDGEASADTEADMREYNGLKWYYYGYVLNTFDIDLMHQNLYEFFINNNIPVSNGVDTESSYAAGTWLVDRVTGDVYFIDPITYEVSIEE